VSAADCYLHIDSKYDAATVYVKAAHCCKKALTTEDCIKFLVAAVELYGDEGRFSMAAKYQKEIAELWESLGDNEKAILAYETAADYFEGEGSSGSAHSCLLKVAHTCALMGNYNRSFEIFEKVAEESVDNDLLKWSVKEYLLKAGICRLCNGDIVDCKRTFEKYVNLSADFGTTKEFELLNGLLEAVENHDPGAFATASKRFHEISPLDNWKQTLLLKVKESIGGESGDESDELL